MVVSQSMLFNEMAAGLAKTMGGALRLAILLLSSHTFLVSAFFHLTNFHQFLGYAFSLSFQNVFGSVPFFTLSFHFCFRSVSIYVLFGLSVSVALISHGRTSGNCLFD